MKLLPVNSRSFFSIALFVFAGAMFVATAQTSAARDFVAVSRGGGAVAVSNGGRAVAVGGTGVGVRVGYGLGYNAGYNNGYYVNSGSNYAPDNVVAQGPALPTGTVYTLPQGAVPIVVMGTNYFFANGTYYSPQIYCGSTIYVPTNP